MFNLSGSEFIIILILALVILGPEKLPQAMRRAGKAWGELRKISAGFQDEVRKGFEEPSREVKKTADVVRKAASFPSKKLHYNPLKDPAPALGDGESVAAPDPGEPAAEPPTGSGGGADPPEPPATADDATSRS